MCIRDSHDGNIVVGENAQRQADAVELIFSLLYQSLQAHRDQRKQDDAVQPHHIPVVGRQEAGKGIKNGEGNQHEALRFKMAGQIKAEGKAAQTDFQSHQPGHEFDQVLIGHQNHQPVDGARHIITVQREKIGAYPHIPGIEKAVPAFQLDVYKRQVRYTVKIGAVLLILMGIMTLTGFMNGIRCV